VFRRQFETVAEHNCWTRQEKSTYLITTLQGRATDVLHGIPKGRIFEETLEVLQDCFGDQYLAAAYLSHLISKTHGVGESLQEVTTAAKQLAYRAYPALQEDHIRREAGKAFADGVEDPAIKIQCCWRIENSERCFQAGHVPSS
jgi:hypothetical protein